MSNAVEFEVFGYTARMDSDQHEAVHFLTTIFDGPYGDHTAMGIDNGLLCISYFVNNSEKTAIEILKCVMEHLYGLGISIHRVEFTSGF